MEQKLSRFQIWLLAIRPRTLPAAAAGVVMGSALAWMDGSFQLLPALVALGVALLLQIGSNVANDVYDFERGTDTSERQGPLRVTQAGLLTPAQIKRGMWVIFGLAAVFGLYLAFLRGWVVVWIGLAAILAAITYTGGPFPFGYHGLGDLFAFVFFGPAAVVGTYFVQTGSVSAAAWWMSLPIGLLVTAILVVNNLRDLENDRKAGKRTLAVHLGERGARLEYLLCMTVAYLVVLLAAWLGLVPWLALLTWLSLPLAVKTARTVLTQAGRPLNAALAGTGQVALLFSLLFLGSLVVASLVVRSYR
ncbi:MAG: 1,4-dihydroxy-2-naphthoate polyprenyltransferase [Candidatus Villigracilaceae bacterium]